MAAGFDRRILGAIRATLLLALCAGFVSLGISWLLSEVTPFLYTWDEALHSFRTGAVMGLVLFPLHQYYLQGPGGAWIRRMGFVQGMLMREAVLIGAIVLLLLANRAITATYIACPGGCSTWDFFGSYLAVELWRDTGFAAIVFVVAVYLMQVRRLVGPGVMTRLLLGRYAKPVREERIYLLVDLKGSTAMAERLGDEAAHAFIARVFFDLDRPVTAHGGRIEGYVGDELIAAWKPEAGLRDSAVLQAYAGILEVLRRNELAYRRSFGEAAGVRASLHIGPVVTGECGDSRLVILSIGDTLNTASRMLDVAREGDAAAVISEPLLRRLTLPPELAARPLGLRSLRGREGAMELFALAPAAGRRSMTIAAE